MLVRARDFWGVQNILGYGVRVLGQYYLEESLKCKTIHRVLFDDLALIAVQNFGMLLLFLPFQGRRMIFLQGRRAAFQVWSIWRKDINQVKHLSIGRSHSSKRKSLTKKSAPQNLIVASTVSETGPVSDPKVIGKKIKGTKQKHNRSNQTLKKLKILSGLCVLSLMGILSRIIFFKSLEHTSYPVTCIVKAFKLFPGTAEVSPLPTISRRMESEVESMLGTFLTTVGIFVYVFAEEEEEHNRNYLKKNLIRLSRPNEVFPDTTTHKIIRLGLAYLKDQSNPKPAPNSKPNKHPESTQAFLHSILSGTQPNINNKMTIQEQIRSYYHPIIAAYSGKMKCRGEMKCKGKTGCSGKIGGSGKMKCNGKMGSNDTVKYNNTTPKYNSKLKPCDTLTHNSNPKLTHPNPESMAKQLLASLNKHKKTELEKRIQQVFAQCILRTLLGEEERSRRAHESKQAHESKLTQGSNRSNVFSLSNESSRPKVSNASNRSLEPTPNTPTPTTSNTSDKLSLFLAHRKIKAAIFLAAHFWTETIKECTQILFIKKYRMENTTVQHGISMITAIICWLVLFLNGYNQNKVLDYVNVIVFLSLFSFSQTLGRKKSTTSLSPPQQIGMKIGRKVLSLLISSILHDQQFTTAHATGLFLLFVGSLLNESIYETVYSKWTFRDNLIKKPL